MIGNDSIDISLSSLYKSWYKFKAGKSRTNKLEEFEYKLEKNIFNLYRELRNKTYKHGQYHRFAVIDNKKRQISVADIKDRLIHRLLYDYLVTNFDKKFIYDVWSCRKNKGLIGAINRAQLIAKKYKDGYIWRADIKKFFDNVNQEVLFKILKREICCKTALWLLKEIIISYRISINNQGSCASFSRGLPIGNLTSQIFANIYLNELDRFILHHQKPLAYLRYGDDFLVFKRDLARLKKIRENVIRFAFWKLSLSINPKNDVIFKTKRGIRFLGVEIFSNGRRLNKRNISRATSKINLINASSYCGLVKQHYKKLLNVLNWKILEKIEDE